MRFAGAIFAAVAATVVAATPLEGRQEAARFGSVTVNQGLVAPGEDLNINYNSTTARSIPQFVDFYLQGNFKPSGSLTPKIMLARNRFNSKDIILVKTVPLPPVDKLGETENWLVWADVTYEQDGFNLIGGTSAPLSVAPTTA